MTDDGVAHAAANETSTLLCVPHETGDMVNLHLRSGNCIPLAAISSRGQGKFHQGKGERVVVVAEGAVAITQRRPIRRAYLSA